MEIVGTRNEENIHDFIIESLHNDLHVPAARQPCAFPHFNSSAVWVLRSVTWYSGKKVPLPKTAKVASYIAIFFAPAVTQGCEFAAFVEWLLKHKHATCCSSWNNNVLTDSDFGSGTNLVFRSFFHPNSRNFQDNKL